MSIVGRPDLVQHVCDIVAVEFFADVPAMGLDRQFAQEELISDLSGREAFPDQFNDFSLPFGEPEGIILRKIGGYDQVWICVCPLPDYVFDGFFQYFSSGYLQHEGVCPKVSHVQGDICWLVGGEDDDPQRRM
jgi:hypothetical protein